MPWEPYSLKHAQIVGPGLKLDQIVFERRQSKSRALFNRYFLLIFLLTGFNLYFVVLCIIFPKTGKLKRLVL